MSNVDNTPPSETPFDTQCEILTELWLNYRNEESVETLFEYFDMGFPLAYAYHEGLIKLEPVGKVMITQCWEGVLEAFGIEEDTSFEALEDLGEIG